MRMASTFFITTCENFEVYNNPKVGEFEFQYQGHIFLLCSRFPYGYGIGSMYCENLEFKKPHAKLFT
jgi:hypothetical protein